MPIPAKHLWAQLQKQMGGRPEEEQLQILRRGLSNLHDEWKGPYKDLRDRLRRQVARLENHEAVRFRSGQQGPFHVYNQGDARVVLAGTVNAGKSALVEGLTGASTIVADDDQASILNQYLPPRVRQNSPHIRALWRLEGADAAVVTEGEHLFAIRYQETTQVCLPIEQIRRRQDLSGL